MKLLQGRDCEPQRGGEASLPANCVPGITPMLQLIRCITRKPSDKTMMSLIFANQVSSAESALSRKITFHGLWPLALSELMLLCACGCGRAYKQGRWQPEKLSLGLFFHFFCLFL